LLIAKNFGLNLTVVVSGNENMLRLRNEAMFETAVATYGFLVRTGIKKSDVQSIVFIKLWKVNSVGMLL